MVLTHVSLLYYFHSDMFMPYVEDVANAMIPLIKFQYYEGVRSSAALCIPKLLRALVVGLRKGGHPQNTTMELLMFALAPLLEQVFLHSLEVAGLDLISEVSHLGLANIQLNLSYFACQLLLILQSSS